VEAEAKAGIDLTVSPQSFNTIASTAVPSNHAWQLDMYGEWVYDPDYAPTGEEIFASGATSNVGSYSDATMDKLITETNASSSLSAFKAYATYAAEQLPVLYMPNSYSVQTVKSDLHGVTFSPLTTFLPEYWYFTKS
jgi:peptide/nickel transport system substrate-binding protein